MEMIDGLSVLNSFPLAELEVGQHLYWHIGNLKVHGQVFITSWVVIAILVTASIAGTRNMQRIPSGIQNFMEYALEFLRDLAKKPNWGERVSSLGAFCRHSLFVHFCGKLVWCACSLEAN
jgi:F0F1-type ATP synthase membrane subunit a